MPDDFEDLEDGEQQAIIDQLKAVVASVDPAALREEILQLGGLIDQARLLEQREIETKLARLKQLLADQGIFKDAQLKLPIFTEHKDILIIWWENSANGT